MHTEKEIGSFSDWAKKAGEALDEAYLEWFAKCGSAYVDGQLWLNLQGGYVDLKTGYFVPVGKPKWKKKCASK